MRFQSRHLRYWWIAWSALTWLSLMLSTAGSLLPYWIRGSILNKYGHLTNSDIGLFRRCTYPVYTADGSVILLHHCGHYDFLHIPNAFWQVSLVCLTLSCALSFMLTFIIFLLGFWLHILAIHTVQRSLQMCQLCAGILSLFACLLYPLGWKKNSEFKQICGSSTSSWYSLGRCEIGWAYVLVASGSFFTLLASLLPTMMSSATQGICIWGKSSSSNSHEKHDNEEEIINNSPSHRMVNFRHYPQINQMRRSASAQSHLFPMSASSIQLGPAGNRLSLGTQMSNITPSVWSPSCQSMRLGTTPSSYHLLAATTAAARQRHHSFSDNV